MSKLVNISELCKILNLIDAKTKKPQNHVLRYWEKEFIQIKPKKINKHRYYNSKDIKIIKFIKELIRDNKMSIASVKKILKTDINKLDYINQDSLRKHYLKINLKKKSIDLLNKINNLKKNGKKNSFKS